MMVNRDTLADRLSPISPANAREPTCEIRVLSTVEELIESYRLRYEMYGELGYLQHFNPSGVEIDEYDMWSVPFGAFDRASGAMIGTLRLITTEVQPDHEYLVHCVLGDLDDDELTQQVLRQRPYLLPAITSDQIGRQIDAFNPQHFAVYELSRFIVRPDHRGSGVSRGLALMASSYAIRSAPAILIAGCLPEHVPMYARYGYLQLPNTGLDYFDSVGQIASTIICRPDVMWQPTPSEIDDLLRPMTSGASEHAQDLGRGSRVLFRFAAPRRSRRRTMEW